VRDKRRVSDEKTTRVKFGFRAGSYIAATKTRHGTALSHERSSSDFAEVPLCPVSRLSHRIASSPKLLTSGSMLQLFA
ncbi:hypothetical protein ALC56_01107, partial [Trachymyrmex septentrionalis]